MTRQKESIALKLKEILRLENISQVRLAELIDVTPRTVNRWVKAESKPDETNIDAIETNTGYSATWLNNPDDTSLAVDNKTPVYRHGAEKIDISKAAENNNLNPQVRKYRELAQMDEDTLGEIQTWINSMESYRPGFTTWFRHEFQNRFPEFDDWKRGLGKEKKATGTDN